MHTTVIVFSLYAAWRWGDWRNWQKYHSSMLFIVVGNLLYNFLYGNRLLWKFKPEVLVNHTIGELFFTFIVFPLTTLIFLTNYPEKTGKRLIRIIKYIAIYFIVEVIFQFSGGIIYQNGWNIWWSLAWNCMMFPMLALHSKKPLVTYLVSIFIIAGMMIKFPVLYIK